MKTLITNKERTIFIDLTIEELFFEQPKNIEDYKVVENDNYFKNSKTLFNKVIKNNEKKDTLLNDIDALTQKLILLRKQLSEDSEKLSEKIIRKYIKDTNEISTLKLKYLFNSYKEKYLNTRALDYYTSNDGFDGAIFFEYDGTMSYHKHIYDKYVKKFDPLLEKEQKQLSSLNKKLKKYNYKIIAYTYLDFNEDPETMLDYKLTYLDDSNLDSDTFLSYKVFKKIENVLFDDKSVEK